jgi:Domain of unknown function (DUF4062)
MPSRYFRPERRYEVFISSTFVDLAPIRQLINEATIRCGHVPIGMESFAAGPRDVDYIRECIEAADIFVILIGARYGSMVKRVGGHFLDFEYAEALRLKKPILAYVLADDEYQMARSSLKESDTERKYDKELRRFRESVKKDADGYGRIIEYFSLKDDQRAQVKGNFERALALRASGLTEGGWVRGELYDNLRGRTGLSEIVSKNPFFQDFVRRLDKFDTLSLRIGARPLLKEKIAHYFLEQHLGWLIQKGVRAFFFESGSTIAFLSQAFVSALHDEEWMRNISNELRIHTNNIITYLDLGLSERIHVELYPYGPPEKKYGATFGPLTSLTKLPTTKVLENLELKQVATTDSHGREAPKERWEEEVEKLERWFSTHYRRHAVIFMTASGLETNPESPYYGPHVGSYYNMLFKRAILKSACPAVMFLDEEKILSKPFDKDQCYPLCGGSMSWKAICETTPFAVAAPCTSDESVQKIIEVFAQLGMTRVEKSAEEKVHLLVVSNDRFHDVWS